MKYLTENQSNWSNIITEEFGVKDNVKLGWMSKYAQVHELFEAVQSGSDNGIYATPLNTMGMGDPMNPAVAKNPADFHSATYQRGSGDIAMSTLTMSLEIAAMTIGFELVPVIPSTGPWAILQYMDFPYAGGKLGRINETSLDGKGEGDENKPIYIKFNCPAITYAAGKTKYDIAPGSAVKVAEDGGTSKALNGTFIGFSRIDNNIIIKVTDCGDANTSIADVFEVATKITITSDAVTSVKDAEKGKMRAELVAAAADHVQGFSNFFDGSDDPMTRAQNETGVGNTIGARFFSKLITMGSYEVTGTVTRQQLQDMPLYGIDIVGKVLEAMQNEISQAINNRILDRVFKLGVTNAKIQKEYQGADLNLFFGKTPTDSKNLADFPSASKYVDINGNKVATDWGPVFNATQNTAAENFTTHQRRIMTRILAAANLIANVSRWGRANWVVTNTKILSALQDCAGYVAAPMDNTLSQSNNASLYFAGSIAGLNLYIDPYMTWDDTRVCVGRKGDGETPGVVFMPYILADQVQITAEGTMAPKLLTNSRYAIVDAGFHPEQQYYTFMIDTDGAYLI